MRLVKALLFSVLFVFSLSASAAHLISTKMYKVSASGKGRYIGIIIAKNTKRGLLLVPRLHDLTPGMHGFHLHQTPSCKRFGKAAAGHWDPKKTGRHLGPNKSHGHRGDLPALYVNKSGFAKRAVLAPHLHLKNLQGHALVIHKGGDNYSDKPPLGGGGARIACGVIH